MTHNAQSSAASGRLRPYLMEDAPVSAGRLLLAVGFAHYCALQWGMSGADIDQAFAASGRSHEGRRVRTAANLIGELFGRKVLHAWIRPFGGGEPAPLRANSWELDDFADRFAASAVDPARLYDAGAAPTHWIFVDREEWDELLEASVADTAAGLRAATRARSGRSATTASAPAVQTGPETDGRDLRVEGTERLLRLGDVMSRTGLSRSTIYRKMGSGSFPASVPIPGSRPLWREREIVAWMADPR